MFSKEIQYFLNNLTLAYCISKGFNYYLKGLENSPTSTYQHSDLHINYTRPGMSHKEPADTPGGNP